ncbi:MULTISPECIES: SusC/RagA family TonB-linked outer membrane protein [Flavobacteriaceae]|uniref:TonB-dependent receptor n=2 Tax=Flavobacteriaceae TaxID=49546 RepID=A0A4Y8AP55_9FLAO|nr:MULTISPECIES: TonB-dependent receptor [Flavobacteriaceae]TEW72199.1 TonB-dependent receptor [Gramella jeungdoensis]
MKNFKFFLFSVILLFPALMFAQQTIKGNVSEATSNSPLPGVGIIIKGTIKGAATDFDGNYVIENVKPGDVLVFSYIGFNTQEITVGSNSTINVAMVESAESLDEVVIIGYGVTTVKDATGSVTSVKAKDLNKGAIVSPDQMLTGKVAGVQITSDGGAPGGGSQIRIRGGSSLNASNDPLFIIDGVPVDKDGIAGIRNPLNTINPNDIESYTILKDASATAIYGSRASNGVIIITTKKGSSGELQGSYSANFSVNRNSDTVDALSADQFRAYVNENGLPSDIALLGNANTNWQDEIFKTGYGTSHNLSLNGSSGAFKFRTSFGYTNQSGTLKTSNLERGTFSVSIGTALLEDHLKIDFNNKLSLINNRFGDTGAIGSAISFDPTQPVYSDSPNYGGYFEWLQANGNPISVGAPRNPLALLEQRNNNSHATRNIGNIQFDYKMHFLPELRANLNLGYDISSSDGDNSIFDSATSSNLELATLGNISHFEQDKKNILSDFYLNYAKDLDAINSSLDFMVGYSYQNFKNEGFDRNNIQDRALTEVLDYYNELNLQSFFGRLKYSFVDKYLLTLTYRRDGSSRFSKSNRWGNFPSAAFAWKIYEEPFIKNVDAITNLKLRLSWGITGQQDIGDYYPAIATYLASTNTAQYQFGSSYLTTFRAQPFNSTLKWEETETYNAGIDFGLFDNVLSGAVDAYFRKTKDLLNFIPFPGGSSLSNAGNANIGKMENKGIEVTLSTRAIRSDDLNLDFDFNFTYADTEITQLTTNDGPDYEGVPVGGFDGGVGNYIQRHTVGYSPYAFFVFQQVYDANGKPIEGVYVDRNNDGSISNADRYRFEKPTADFTAGFTTNLTYKDWNFNMAWRGNVGNYVYNNVDSAKGFRDQLLNPSFPNVIENGVSNILDSDFINGGTNRYLSDYYVQEASFIKLDNVSIGYDFGSVFGETSNLSVSGTAQNLITITDYEGLDPEVGSGIDFNIYPRPRIYMVGVNLNF